MSIYINKLYFTTIRRLNSNENKKNYSPLNFTNLNLFIGPNGSGKSTVIDLIYSLSNHANLSTLMRENNPTESTSEIQIELSNKELLIFEFNAFSKLPKPKDEENSIDYHDIKIGHSNGFLEPIQLKKSDSTYNLQLLESKLKNFTNKLKINYLHQNTILNLTPTDIKNSLNKVYNNLDGIVNDNTKEKLIKSNNSDMIDFAISFSLEDGYFICNNDEKNMISFAFDDDITGINNIPIELLPSGWKAISKILTFLENADKKSICLIEEPETHLHPKLQRVLISKIMDYIIEKKLQVFIATHSSTFINSIEKDNIKISLFEANTDSIVKLDNPHQLLDALGTKASDILQINGVIWIEGPSDRIYIKLWLQLWCNKNNLKCPIENIDYSFSIYGGSILNHFSVNQEVDNLINMLTLNRNAIVIIDNDNQFKKKEDNFYRIKENGKTKERIINEIKAIGREELYIWLTSGYTIESYIEENFIKLYFDIKIDGKLTLKSGKNKVTTALNYSKKTTTFKNRYDLDKQIEKMYYTIIKWSK